jgi:hypothetical protein
MRQRSSAPPKSGLTVISAPNHQPRHIKGRIRNSFGRCHGAKLDGAPSGSGDMHTEKYDRTRTDGSHIGKAVRELIRLMIEEGLSWQTAADRVAIKRTRAYRALHKPHVIAYRRTERAKFIELLGTRVPLKLDALMNSENAAAAVRAALSLEDMSQQSRAEPTRRIQTGGIVIVLGAPGQRALPAESAMPVLEMEPAEE